MLIPGHSCPGAHTRHRPGAGETAGHMEKGWKRDGKEMEKGWKASPASVVWAHGQLPANRLPGEGGIGLLCCPPVPLESPQVIP